LLGDVSDNLSHMLVLLAHRREAAIGLPLHLRNLL
jgi:hypothetical protein